MIRSRMIHRGVLTRAALDHAREVARPPAERDVAELLHAHLAPDARPLARASLLAHRSRALGELRLGDREERGIRRDEVVRDAEPCDLVDAFLAILLLER